MTLTLYNSLGQQVAPVNAPSIASTPFNSGTSLTLGALGSDVLVQCSTTAGSSYTLTIPTSVGSLFKIIVADYGTVATGNVTVSPVSGSIKGQNVLNIVGMSLTLMDGPLGWSSV